MPVIVSSKSINLKVVVLPKRLPTKMIQNVIHTNSKSVLINLINAMAYLIINLVSSSFFCTYTHSLSQYCQYCLNKTVGTDIYHGSFHSKLLPSNAGHNHC